MSQVSMHLKDIDFRSREQRSRQAIADFKKMYTELHLSSINGPENPRTEGQRTMLATVLWYLMPKREYSEFMKIKKLD